MELSRAEQPGLNVTGRIQPAVPEKYYTFSSWIDLSTFLKVLDKFSKKYK